MMKEADEKSAEIKLFDKHSRLTTSPIYIGYQILKEFAKDPKRIHGDKKINMYEIFNKLKKINYEVPPKQIFLALMFLYISGTIEFKRPYIIILKRDV